MVSFMKHLSAVFYLYQNMSLVQGPIAQENWFKKKTGGPSHDEIVEYMISNTKMP